MSQWPQYLCIGTAIFRFAVHCARRGQTKPGGKYLPLDDALGTAINFTVLYYGGFFAAIGYAP